MLLAQTQTPPPQTINLVEALLPLIPWLVVFFIVVLVIGRTIRRQNQVTAQHVERMRHHMAAVEAKLDRLIEIGERRGGGA